ncbi:MAG: hypothetical protein AAF125_27100, partial [Chloroflexota bacterium]
NEKTPWYLRGQAGQALVEYILIAVLVGAALLVALLATGPVLANIFESAVIAAVGGEDAEATRQPLEDGATSFWLTVTWVATQTPQETPFPTNIANPQPSPTPDGYVPATLVPPEPTVEPEPSETQPPSPTPEDQRFDLEFNDPADQTDWYRLVSDIYLGQDAWEGLFYEDRFEGTTYRPFENPASVRYVRSYDANEGRFLTPTTNLPGMDTEWFSARFRRPIFVYGTQPERIGFRIRDAASGFRVYYQTDTGLCADYRPSAADRDTPSSSIDCLIIDEWSNSPNDDVTAFVDFPAGPDADTPAEYTLYIEYYQTSGAPNIDFDIFSPRTNPDDVGLGGSPVDCVWEQYSGTEPNNRTNSRNFAWSY